MSGLLLTIAIRSRLEVGLKDRLQNQLQRSLYDTVAYGGNRENADFLAPILWDLPLPHSHRLIGALGQFVPDLLKETFHALFFNGREGHSVDARGAIVFLSPLECGAQGFHLADVNVQTPETP